jgi:hypothetical protein
MRVRKAKDCDKKQLIFAARVVINANWYEQIKFKSLLITFELFTCIDKFTALANFL